MTQLRQIRPQLVSRWQVSCRSPWFSSFEPQPSWNSVWCLGGFQAAFPWSCIRDPWFVDWWGELSYRVSFPTGKNGTSGPTHPWNQIWPTHFHILAKSVCLWSSIRLLAEGLNIFCLCIRLGPDLEVMFHNHAMFAFCYWSRRKLCSISKYLLLANTQKKKKKKKKWLLLTFKPNSWDIPIVSW